MKVITAPRASDLPDTLEGVVARDLVNLTERLVRGGLAVTDAGFFGGRYGYGAAFENDDLVMRQFCWCERPDCGVCQDQCWDPGDDYPRLMPHFALKTTPIEVRWYKWIGRSMEILPAELTIDTWRHAFLSAIASLPPEVSNS